MATCPHCKTSTRSDPDAMTVTKALSAKPLGTYSVAGAQTKVVASEVMKLECRCGWSILGFIENESFEGWPSTQTWPNERLTHEP